MTQSFDITQIISWSSAVLQGPQVSRAFSSIVLDSREVTPGALFVAYQGELCHGIKYLPVARERGAVAVLTDSPDFPTDFPVLVVKDAKQAAIHIASQIRKLFKGKVFAITGSAGKSSTKHLLGTLLGEKTQVSPASFNNLLGLSRTLFALEGQTENLVLEMGMNAKGEIRDLCQAFKPQGGMITNIGDAHLGKLGSQKAIYEAKREMFEYFSDFGASLGIVMNESDSWITKAYKETLSTKPVSKVSYSFEPHIAAPIRLISKRVHPQTGRSLVEIDFKGEVKSIELDCYGLHQADNLVSAIAAAWGVFGKSWDEIEAQLSKIKAASHRGEILELGQNVLLIDESYNSNPSALKSSLTSLMGVRPGKRKVIVLSDMLELDEFSKKLHFELGRFVADLFKKAPFRMLAVGEDVSALAEGVFSQLPESRIKLVPRVESLLSDPQILGSEIQEGDVWMVKGSRGGQLDKLVEFMSKNFGPAADTPN